MKTSNVLKFVGIGIIGIGICIGVIFGVRALWNWLIPELFHGPVLTFWQTVGIFLLSKVLLAGVAPGAHHGKKNGKDWRKKYFEKHKQTDAGGQNVAAAEPV
ncbi:MAG: hypothetical protein ABSA76_07590 [Bacteroidales bacterium]